MSHTYALLDISPAAYAEIRQKLVAAGYQHAFHQEGDGLNPTEEVIDMHGIAVRAVVPSSCDGCDFDDRTNDPRPPHTCHQARPEEIDSVGKERP